MRLEYPPQADLSARISLDRESGRLFWRQIIGSGREISRWNNRYAGREIASETPDGYIRVSWGKRHLLAHRVVWVLVHGTQPPDEIDHINGERQDNRPSNLRAASRALNTTNIRSRNKGVKYRADRPRAPWVSRITIGGKQIFLGNFQTKAEAENAYKNAKMSAVADAASRN